MVEAIMNLDINILLWIQQYIRTSWLNPIFVGITTLGDAGIIWVLTTAVLLVNKKTRKIGLMCFFSLFLCLVINNLAIKNIIARDRPFIANANLIPLIKKPTDFSFPSGHSAVSFACGWILFRKLRKPYAWSSAVIALLIALSRLYVGVHYPTDVIAGIIVGIGISYLSEYLYMLIVNKSKKEVLE